VVTRSTSKIGLDPAVVRRARRLAAKAAAPVEKMARTHTTVSVERAMLRLAGISGADATQIPWVNRLVDTVRDQVGLEHGAALPVYDAMRTGGYAELTELAQKAAAGGVSFCRPGVTQCRRGPPPARRSAPA
jgi:beta-lysine 5,6-aminomutase alpha subunit